MLFFFLLFDFSIILIEIFQNKLNKMHDRGNVYLHERFLLRRTPTQLDQRSKCPPWRHTQIPVELFDLMTFVFYFENRKKKKNVRF